jgi:hypothetical protein
VDLQQLTGATLIVLQQDPALDGQAFVDSMLATRPVAVLCRLLMWLQQRPELLQLPALAGDEHASVGQASHGALWLASISGQLQRLPHLLGLSSLLSEMHTLVHRYMQH